MSSLTLAEINEAIRVFEALQPSSPVTFRSALRTVGAILGTINKKVDIFLQRKFAPFYDIDPNNPFAKLGVSEAETDAIVAAFLRDMPVSATEQPDINLDNLVASASEEDITAAKRFGLYLLYCLKLMLTNGVAGGAWYNIRKLSGQSVFTAAGQGLAIASGAAGTGAALVMDEAFDQFAEWLKLSSAFKGEDISALRDMTKVFVTSLLGATTWFGVLQIMDAVDNKTPYQLFGLFALAFFFIGAINAGGELAVGRQIVPLSVEQWHELRPALERIFQRLADKKTRAHLLLNFVAWYSYWDYNEAFLKLARTKGHQQAILWGSLVIFFQFAGLGAFTIEKMFSQRSAIEGV